MKEQQRWIEWIRKLPNWVIGAIGLTTAVISFVVLLQKNVYLGATVLGVLLILGLFCLCLYVASARTPPLVQGGTGLYRFEKYRLLAFVGMIFLVLLSATTLVLEPSQSFIATALTSRSLGLTDLTRDRNIEVAYTDEYLNRYYNVLCFTVSNTGDKAFLLDAIWLEVTSVEPYTITSFPEGPAMPAVTHAYTVTVTPHEDLYLVTDDNFTYNQGEVEQFNIVIQSFEPGYIYEVMVKVDWYDLDEPEAVRQSVLEPHLVDFPARVGLSTILKQAHQVDYFLTDWWAIAAFAGTDSFMALSDDSSSIINANTARFLCPEDDDPQSYLTDEAPELDIRYFSEDSLTQVGIVNLSHYGVGYQYLIVDDELVVQHIGYYEAELISEPSEVQQYAQHFDRLWEISQQ